MSRRYKKPKDGEILEAPATDWRPATRRKWCGTCQVWTWEQWPRGTGIFRHGIGRRIQACKEKKR